MTSEQRTASRDEPRTPGEKMMAAYLDERSVPTGMNPSARGPTPTFGRTIR